MAIVDTLTDIGAGSALSSETMETCCILEVVVAVRRGRLPLVMGSVAARVWICGELDGGLYTTASRREQKGKLLAW